MTSSAVNETPDEHHSEREAIALGLHDAYCEEEDCDTDVDHSERWLRFADVALGSLRVNPVPRGFTRCDECEGHYLLGIHQHVDPYTGDHLGDEEEFCKRCTYGLLPTEKLREEAVKAIREAREYVIPTARWLTSPERLADAVLRKVAEHIGEGR